MDDEAAFAKAGESMRRALALEHLLVTQGEQGMTLFSGAAQPCGCRPMRSTCTTSPVPATR